MASRHVICYAMLCYAMLCYGTVCDMWYGTFSVRHPITQWHIFRRAPGSAGLPRGTISVGQPPLPDYPVGQFPCDNPLYQITPWDNFCGTTPSTRLPRGTISVGQPRLPVNHRGTTHSTRLTRGTISVGQPLLPVIHRWITGKGGVHLAPPLYQLSTDG